MSTIDGTHLPLDLGHEIWLLHSILPRPSPPPPPPLRGGSPPSPSSRLFSPSFASAAEGMKGLDPAPEMIRLLRSPEDGSFNSVDVPISEFIKPGQFEGFGTVSDRKRIVKEGLFFPEKPIIPAPEHYWLIQGEKGSYSVHFFDNDFDDRIDLSRGDRLQVSYLGPDLVLGERTLASLLQDLGISSFNGLNAGRLSEFFKVLDNIEIGILLRKNLKVLEKEIVSLKSLAQEAGFTLNPKKEKMLTGKAWVHSLLKEARERAQEGDLAGAMNQFEEAEKKSKENGFAWNWDKIVFDYRMSFENEVRRVSGKDLRLFDQALEQFDRLERHSAGTLLSTLDHRVWFYPKAIRTAMKLARKEAEGPDPDLNKVNAYLTWAETYADRAWNSLWIYSGEHSFDLPIGEDLKNAYYEEKAEKIRAKAINSIALNQGYQAIQSYDQACNDFSGLRIGKGLVNLGRATKNLVSGFAKYIGL